MNMNELAKQVTLKEGLKQSVSVAQVKEILKITFTILANEPDGETTKILNKYRGK